MFIRCDSPSSRYFFPHIILFAINCTSSRPASNCHLASYLSRLHESSPHLLKYMLPSHVALGSQTNLKLLTTIIIIKFYFRLFFLPTKCYNFYFIRILLSSHSQFLKQNSSDVINLQFLVSGSFRRATTILPMLKVCI
ncbi:hypothetical protein KFK09_028936 [Dendrobium nobile]|uniref:Uncharacterized protein n=1 Tax=Dendrobium nobile TaxID=94219 RepID=A0A8T3A2Z9_DENNO|nr:hypothetical protein KFK09_028936 [Dendrobium nobile]